ncbi:unnamed protein product [Parnassius apollo]|uniref:(apollo) hypothetical protein n=1 Tax=Parnassius apollo TaxID=110799 RepID=A0A8S3WGW3_PARAO|nr:unnamed protein product [Parnassius apollo]
MMPLEATARRNDYLFVMPRLCFCTGAASLLACSELELGNSNDAIRSDSSPQRLSLCDAALVFLYRRRVTTGLQ